MNGTYMKTQMTLNVPSHQRKPSQKRHQLQLAFEGSQMTACHLALAYAVIVALQCCKTVTKESKPSVDP